MSATGILLIVSETYPARAGDGRSAYFLHLELNRQGAECRMLTLGSGGASGPMGQGSPIITSPYYPTGALGRVISRLYFAINLIRHGARLRVWIVYGGMLGHRAALLLGAILGRRVIFRSTLWGFDNASVLVRGNPLSRAIHRLAWGYWALNPALADDYRRVIGMSRVLLSPQGVPDPFFRPPPASREEIRRGLNLPAGIPIVIAVGHVIRRKGFPELFQWLSGVKRDYLLILIGEHSPSRTDRLYTRRAEMEALRQEGLRLLGSRVRFLGVRENVWDYLWASDIFLHGAHAEGFPPNALNEALACGLPGLVRRVVGVDEGGPGGAGVCLFAGREEFTRGLERLLASAQLREQLGTDARRSAEQRLRLGQVAARVARFCSTGSPLGAQDRPDPL